MGREGDDSSPFGVEVDNKWRLFIFNDLAGQGPVNTRMSTIEWELFYKQRDQ
jgi:hypothetical protein